MRLFDSGALELLNRALGLSGSGAQNTQLSDELVNQTFDIGGVARRGRELTAGSTGIYWGVLQTSHATAGPISVTVDPYSPAAALVVNGYPTPTPPGWDIYLFGADLRIVSGNNADFLDAALMVVPPASQVAFASDEGSGMAPPIVNTGVNLAIWDTALTVAGRPMVTNAVSGESWRKFGFRLRRGASLVLASTAQNTNTVTLQCHMLLGIFPAGLGQDIAP